MTKKQWNFAVFLTKIDDLTSSLQKSPLFVDFMPKKGNKSGSNLTPFFCTLLWRTHPYIYHNNNIGLKELIINSDIWNIILEQNNDNSE